MLKRARATRTLLPASASTHVCFAVTKIKMRIRCVYDFQKPSHCDTVVSKGTSEHLKTKYAFYDISKCRVIFLHSDQFRSAFRIPEARIPFLASEFWPNIFSSTVYSDCIIYKALDVCIKDPCIFLEGLRETMKTLSHYVSVVIRNETSPEFVQSFAVTPTRSVIFSYAVR